MLNRHTKNTPCTGIRRKVKNPRQGILSATLPPPGRHPDDVEASFEFLRSLLELQVIQRLEAIFEMVRQLEAAGCQRMARRAIRLPEVLRILGVSKSTLYARLNPKSPSYDSLAPKPFKLGSQPSERAPSVWWESDVTAYVEACAQMRRV